ncbi:hypothetical protein ZWY2020_035700 [Hordeum vulgare]|nr:hypothetical protein ZWY2020_035700 [Hordeum vulgare]
MRADLSTIQQTLTPEAAAALAQAMDEAARRRHVTTTPLHVAAALLAAPASVLRQACARAVAAGGAAAASGGAGAHPLHCRALELCFSVALDRLPAFAGAALGGGAAAPPVSNALVAALKRAQAQQRRGCPETAQQPLLAVKVELEQLVLSILDDPSVSRVMREASFSSATVKNTIEQSLTSPSPSSSTAACSPVPTPTPFSPSPSSLLRAGTTNAYINPRLAAAAAGAGCGDDARKVLDVMLKPARRNPVIIGDSGPDMVLKEAIRRIPTASSPSLAAAKILHLEAELAKLAGDKVAMAERIGKLGAVVERLVGEHGGVILDLGDLKWMVEGPAAPSSEGAKAAVAEMGRLIRRFGRGEVWAVATAACATYLRCKIYHPGMEDEWDLQAMPIAGSTPLAGAALRPGSSGTLSNSVRMLSPRPGRQRHQWLSDGTPGGGLTQMVKPAMCMLCKGGYVSVPKAANTSLPHWLQQTNDQNQSKAQELKWKRSTGELEKKWRETCAHIHLTHAGAPALSVPLASSGTCPRVEVKLPIARGAAIQTVKMNTNQDKPASSPMVDLEEPPRSPVKTDLMLGRLDAAVNPTIDKERKENYEGLTALQKAKIARISDIDSFKRLIKGLTEKVSWQSDAASAIAAVVVQCRSGSEKRRTLRTRGDIWLMFVGPDKAGKRKMVNALSELMANTRPVIVNFGGDSELGSTKNDGLNMGFWGKTALDRVTEAVRQNPFSVIVLECIDRLDTVVRGKIKRAIETGRLPDSRGREVSLGNVIFVLTTNWVPDELKGPDVESLLQAELRMLEIAGSSWQLELSIGDKQAKHRADWLCDDVRPAKVPKELSSSHGLSLDLNLAVGALDDTESSHNSSDISVEQEQEKGQLAVLCSTPAPDCDLLELIDDAIVFRPVDFNPFRKTIRDCISAKFELVIGSINSFRIDEDAIDHMVSSVWLTDERLEDWAEEVIMPSIARLWHNVKHDSARAVVRLALVAEEALPRWCEGREGLPATVTITIDGM